MEDALHPGPVVREEEKPARGAVEPPDRHESDGERPQRGSNEVDHGHALFGIARRREDAARLVHRQIHERGRRGVGRATVDGDARVRAHGRSERGDDAVDEDPPRRDEFVRLAAGLG